MSRTKGRGLSLASGPDGAARAWRARPAIIRGSLRIRQRRHEGVHPDVDGGPVLLDRALPAPPDSREREQRPWFVPLHREPMARGRLAPVVRRAERRRRDKAAPPLEAILPEA